MFPSLHLVPCYNILHSEKSAWHSYFDTHLEMQIASCCLATGLQRPFPRLSRLHVQVRPMGQFGLSGGIPWLHDSDGTFCFVGKQDVESASHFLLDCSYFKQNFLSLWRNLKLKITVSNQADGVHICQFIDNLDRDHKVLLLLGPLFTIRQCNKYVNQEIYSGSCRQDS